MLGGFTMIVECAIAIAGVSTEGFATDTARFDGDVTRALDSRHGRLLRTMQTSTIVTALKINLA
jgi:hypothetical protein